MGRAAVRTLDWVAEAMTMRDASLIEELPITGVSLVEASAGTGKTYTIAGLFVRLILQGHQTIDKILAVTFTRAATAELKLRIAERLRIAMTELDGREIKDVLIKSLAATCDHDDMRNRAKAATLNLDLAPIYTIDGFFQRILADFPTLTRQLSDSDELVDEVELTRIVLRSFWRKTMASGDPELVASIAAEGLSLDGLLSDLRPYCGRPELKVVASTPMSEKQSAAIYRRWESAHATLSNLWQSDEGQAQDSLLEQGVQDGRSYNARLLKVSISSLTKFIERPKSLSETQLGQVARLGQRAIDEKNKNGAPPEGPLFAAVDEALEAWMQLAPLDERRLSRFRADALLYVNDQLPAVRRARRVQTYNGILNVVHHALNEPGCEPLLDALRRSFPFALVDEFQDTSGAQAGVFQSVYAGRDDVALYQVGDPKQAIYQFRGADVYAYLKARGKTDHQLRLPTNWRSTPQLVDNVNRLFGNANRPFLLSEIGFSSVQPAAKTDRAELVLESAEQSLNVTGLAVQRVEGDSSTPQAAIALAAQHVAHLLALTDSGQLSLDGRPLVGGDIAVLLDTNSQLELCMEALRELDVACVVASRRSVFESAEAQHVELLLAALLNPRDSALVRAAMLTPLMGYSLQDAATIADDDGAWDQLLFELEELRLKWRQDGVAGVVLRTAAGQPGGRRLTNYRQISELLAREEVGAGLRPDATLHWLNQRRRDGDTLIDSHQLQLDTDAELVKLSTIHRSKGPAVPHRFLPDLGLPRKPAFQQGRALLSRGRRGPHADGLVSVRR